MQYWSVKTVVESGAANQLTCSCEEAQNHLEDLLKDAVRYRMVADVPLGAFLSGGIDSSLIVSLMQSISRRPVKTFTIGFEFIKHDEAKFARKVAQHLNTDHTELYITAQDALDVIPKLPILYDEPFSDSSQIPTYLISALARQSVTVSLSGDGGDEQFAGYNRYSLADKIWRYTAWVPFPLRALTSRSMTSLAIDFWDKIFFQLRNVLPKRSTSRVTGDIINKLAAILGSRTQLESFDRLISHWLETEKLVIGSHESPAFFQKPGQEAHVSNTIRGFMYKDLISYLPDDILAKVDRASMGVSLEARVPYLDHRVVEFTQRLPLNMLVKSGQSKWLLRQLLYKFVPQHLIERPKKGFGIPLGEWLRDQLREWCEAMLAESRLRGEGFFEAEEVRIKWNEHLSGKKDWKTLLWSVIMFEAWLDEQRR